MNPSQTELRIITPLMECDGQILTDLFEIEYSKIEQQFTVVLALLSLLPIGQKMKRVQYKKCSMLCFPQV